MKLVLFILLLASVNVHALPCVAIPECYESKTLQVSFLRLSNSGNRNNDSYHFGETGLLLILAKLNTKFSTAHLVELADYSVGDLPDDVLNTAITNVSNKALLKEALETAARSKSTCTKSEYKDSCRNQIERTSMLKCWLSDL